MSADVLPFPERRYQPDLEQIVKLLELVDEEKPVEEGGTYFDLAQLAVECIKSVRGKYKKPVELTPARVQIIANSLALGFFALGRELGVSLEILLDIATPKKANGDQHK
jgi:hypothetical protein